MDTEDRLVAALSRLGRKQRHSTPAIAAEAGVDPMDLRIGVESSLYRLRTAERIIGGPGSPDKTYAHFPDLWGLP